MTCPGQELSAFLVCKKILSGNPRAPAVLFWPTSLDLPSHHPPSFHGKDTQPRLTGDKSCCMLNCWTLSRQTNRPWLLDCFPLQGTPDPARSRAEPQCSTPAEWERVHQDFSHHSSVHSSPRQGNRAHNVQPIQFRG